ncbi:putative profilin [Trypanosoma cruzi]|nr:putative profilin [Trypanosoma cruzi]
MSFWTLAECGQLLRTHSLRKTPQTAYHAVVCSHFGSCEGDRRGLVAGGPQCLPLFLFCYTSQPLFVNGLRAVRSDVAGFSVLNGAVVREGVCLHILHGREDSATHLAERRQAAALRSTRRRSRHNRRRFRRMSGRIRPFIVVGAALPKQRAACDLQGACGSTEEWAGTASCLRAEAPFGAKRLAWHQGCVFCCTD